MGRVPLTSTLHFHSFSSSGCKSGKGVRRPRRGSFEASLSDSGNNIARKASRIFHGSLLFNFANTLCSWLLSVLFEESLKRKEAFKRIVLGIEAASKRSIKIKEELESWSLYVSFKVILPRLFKISSCLSHETEISTLYSLYTYIRMSDREPSLTIAFSIERTTLTRSCWYHWNQGADLDSGGFIRNTRHVFLESPCIIPAEKMPMDIRIRSRI